MIKNDVQADPEHHEVTMNNPKHNLEEQHNTSLKDGINPIEKEEMEARQRVFNQSPEY